MKYLNEIKKHLSDNGADTHTQMIIIMAIAFVAGAIIIAAIYAAIKANYKPGMESKIHSALD